jgi:two-component system NarL family response regulator
MDLRLPLMTGAEATAAICSEFPEAKVIVLTISAGDEDIWRALQAGAHAYLLKTVQREELLKTIRAVDAGEHRLPPEIADRLAERMSRHALTHRELETLEMIVRGKSNKGIGAELSISEITVKRHVSNLLEKLHAGHRTQAATLAIQRGIVHLP